MTNLVSLDRNRVGQFLRARRGQLRPQDVGLPESRSSRRVPGLRREEVAQLACISVDFYARLEKGRVNASVSVLSALGEALRLDDDHLDYLFEIAGKSLSRQTAAGTQRISAGMKRLLEQFTDLPAMVLGKRLEILAWNHMATVLYDMDFAETPAHERNYVRMLFVDPRMRKLHGDWDSSARTCVAMLRSRSVQLSEDPDLVALVTELSLRSDAFRTLWESHEVSSVRSGTNVFHHLLIGDVELDCDTWVDPNDMSCGLMVINAEPGTSGHQALRALAAWDSDQARHA